MLHVSQSQRIEQLIDAAQYFFDQTPLAVFEPRQLLVPSHGIGVWLQLRLADRQGICAQIDTDFIGSYQWKLYSKVLRNAVPDRSPLSRSVMQWRIFAYLTEQHENPDSDPIVSATLEPLIDKLFDQGSKTQIRRQIWGMAEQIAQVFAAYVVYRPQWLKVWANNQKLNLGELLRAQAGDQPLPDWLLARYVAMQPWQALLWRELFADAFTRREALMQQFWQVLAEEPARRRDLPAAISVFTVVLLPPAELDFLRRLAQYCQIHVLHYNPSQEYWADSVDPRWLSRHALKYPESAKLRDSRHRLLTRFGKQARDVFGLLSNLSGGDEGEWEDRFIEQTPKTLLQRLQRDMLDLNDPDVPSIVYQPADQSLLIHACHSALRQLEVLREELLHWFGQDPTRQPSDVLVLAPNLRDIAPLIRAVFPSGTGVGDLPVEITGLAAPDAEALWQALTGRVALLDGRLSCETLLDWLSLLPVQRAYGLDRDQVQKLGELLVAAGFRRGFDAAHLQLTLAEQDQDTRFTLRFALDRLLLGMAMPVQAVHANVLSMPSVAREDFELIATLARVYADLDQYRDWLNDDQRSVSDWLTLLREQLFEAFSDELDNRGWTGVLRAMDEMQQNLDASNRPDVPLPLRFVLDEVQAALETAPPGSIPSGRMTFARLGTLRPLPYRLIVMLGLEAGQFPNRDQKNTFDLMAVLPSQLGDRSREDDDLGAFLDGLLLAQEACWLFYNGFDVADPHPRQPAGPVQELIDYLNHALIDGAANDCDETDPSVSSTGSTSSDQQESTVPMVQRYLLRQHSLLPFEQDNFWPPQPDTAVMRLRQPRMLEGTWLQVARQLLSRQQQQDVPIWATLADQVGNAAGAYPFGRIVSQLISPAQHFLQHVRVTTLGRDQQLASLEPLTLNALDQYQLRDLHQHSEQALEPELLMDLLPVGAAKDAYFLQSARDAAQVERRVDQYAEDYQKLGVDVCTEQLLLMDGWQLSITVPQGERSGQTSDRAASGMPVAQAAVAVWLRQSASSARGKQLLRVWLEHLAWQVYRQTRFSDVEADSGRTIAVYSKSTVCLPPIEADQAWQWLHDWLAVWQQAATTPWVLPPELALDGANGLKLDKDAQLKFNPDKLVESWLGEGFVTFNVRDNRACALHPDWQLILQGQDAEASLRDYLDQHLERLYGPLVRHLEVCE